MLNVANGSNMEPFNIMQHEAAEMGHGACGSSSIGVLDDNPKPEVGIIIIIIGKLQTTRSRYI